MTKPMIRIHDAQTNEIIDREMNAAELKQYEADQAARVAQAAQAAAKAQAKAELLERLGITEQEAQLLLS